MTDDEPVYTTLAIDALAEAVELEPDFPGLPDAEVAKRAGVSVRTVQRARPPTS